MRALLPNCADLGSARAMAWRSRLANLRVLLDGVGGFASGRRRRKQLVDEEVCQPLLVPFRGPAPVADEQPVELGGHECVDDVRGVALSQPGPEGTGPGEGAGDLPL